MDNYLIWWFKIYNTTKQTEFKKVIKPYNLALTNTDRKHFAKTL